MRMTAADRAALTHPTPPLVEGLEWGRIDPAARQEWLLPGAIPAGTLTLLQGRKGTGKSTVLSAIAASITGGPLIPGWAGPKDGRVLWSCREEDWSRVVLPRLLAASAPVAFCARPQIRTQRGGVRPLYLPDDQVILMDMLREGGIRLLVLDSIVSMAHPSLDIRIPQQARVYGESLAEALGVTGCTAIGSQHLRKGTGGDVRDQGLGSVELVNVARSILRCDEHPMQRGVRLLTVVVVNFGRPMVTKEYRMTGHGEDWRQIEWLGDSDVDAETAAEGRGSEAERDEWTDTDALLVAAIGEDWVRVASIINEAERAGISSRMVRRAKARLHIPSRRLQVGDEGHWEWGPPPGGWPTPPPATAPAQELQGGHVRARGALGGEGPATPRKPPKKRKAAKAPPPAHVPAPNGEEGGSSDG